MLNTITPLDTMTAVVKQSNPIVEIPACNFDESMYEDSLTLAGMCDDVLLKVFTTIGADNWIAFSVTCKRFRFLFYYVFLPLIEKVEPLMNRPVNILPYLICHTPKYIRYRGYPPQPDITPHVICLTPQHNGYRIEPMQMFDYIDFGVTNLLRDGYYAEAEKLHHSYEKMLDQWPFGVCITRRLKAMKFFTGSSSGCRLECLSELGLLCEIAEFIPDETTYFFFNIIVPFILNLDGDKLEASAREILISVVLRHMRKLLDKSDFIKHFKPTNWFWKNFPASSDWLMHPGSMILFESLTRLWPLGQAEEPDESKFNKFHLKFNLFRGAFASPEMFITKFFDPHFFMNKSVALDKRLGVLQYVLKFIEENRNYFARMLYHDGYGWKKGYEILLYLAGFRDEYQMDDDRMAIIYCILRSPLFLSDFGLIMPDKKVVGPYTLQANDFFTHPTYEFHKYYPWCAQRNKEHGALLTSMVSFLVNYAGDRFDAHLKEFLSITPCLGVACVWQGLMNKSQFDAGEGCVRVFRFVRELADYENSQPYDQNYLLYWIKACQIFVCGCGYSGFVQRSEYVFDNSYYGKLASYCDFDMATFIVKRLDKLLYLNAQQKQPMYVELVYPTILLMLCTSPILHAPRVFDLVYGLWLNGRDEPSCNDMNNFESLAKKMWWSAILTGEKRPTHGFFIDLIIKSAGKNAQQMAQRFWRLVRFEEFVHSQLNSKSATNYLLDILERSCPCTAACHVYALRPWLLEWKLLYGTNGKKKVLKSLGKRLLQACQVNTTHNEECKTALRNAVYTFRDETQVEYGCVQEKPPDKKRKLN